MLKRSNVHLRLIPKNIRTREGKQHVTIALAKIFQTRNSQHSNHPATKLGCTSSSATDEIAGLLRPKQVTFHSQGVKAKAALGLTV